MTTIGASGWRLRRYARRCAMNGERPRTDGWNGLAVVEVLEALQLALLQGRRVELAEVRGRHPDPRPAMSVASLPQEAR